MYDLNELKSIMKEKKLVDVFIDFELEYNYTGYIADVDTTGLLLAYYDHTSKEFLGFAFFVYFSGFEIVPNKGRRAELYKLMTNPPSASGMEKSKGLFEGFLKYCKEKHRKCCITFNEDMNDDFYSGYEEDESGFISEMHKEYFILEHTAEDKKHTKPSYIYKSDIIRMFTYY